MGTIKAVGGIAAVVGGIIFGLTLASAIAGGPEKEVDGGMVLFGIGLIGVGLFAIKYG